MHVVHIGTFLLPIRFAVADLVGGARGALAAALAGELREFEAEPDPAAPGALIFDLHRALGAKQLETMIYSGTMGVPGLGTVHLHLSALAVGFVVLESRLPDDVLADLEDPAARARFKEFETPLQDAVSPLIQTWCARIAKATPAWLAQPKHPRAMPGSSLLWWHRIAVDPQPGHEFPAAHWYGVPVDLARGTTARVGNGFTNIYGTVSPTLLDGVVEGIMVATQRWLLIDEAERHISDHLIRLTRAVDRRDASVDSQYLEALELTNEVTLRTQTLAEDVRYLANARLGIMEAAERSWRIAAEAERLEQHTQALRDLLALHRERIFNDRDDRRNRLLFVFTAVTLVQSILVWYDFLTEDKTAVGDAPRPAIAITVLLLTVATVTAALASRLVRRSRGRRRAEVHVPRQRSTPSPAPDKASAPT